MTEKEKKRKLVLGVKAESIIPTLPIRVPVTPTARHPNSCVRGRVKRPLMNHRKHCRLKIQAVVVEEAPAPSRYSENSTPKQGPTVGNSIYSGTSKDSRRSIKEYKGKTDSNSPTRPNKVFPCGYTTTIISS